MRTFFAVFFILFSLSASVIGGDCPLYDQLDADAQTALRNQRERIGDLAELVHEIATEGISEEGAYEWMYWATMAESAVFRFGDDVPDCGDYAVMNDTLDGIIGDVYAASSQMVVSGRVTNEFQQQNIAAILIDRLDSLTGGVEVWTATYNELSG